MYVYICSLIYILCVVYENVCAFVEMTTLLQIFTSVRMYACIYVGGEGSHLCKILTRFAYKESGVLYAGGCALRLHPELVPMYVYTIA